MKIFKRGDQIIASMTPSETDLANLVSDKRRLKMLNKIRKKVRTFALIV
jgi:hypothetical protein